MSDSHYSVTLDCESFHSSDTFKSTDLVEKPYRFVNVQPKRIIKGFEPQFQTKENTRAEIEEPNNVVGKRRGFIQTNSKTTLYPHHSSSNDTNSTSFPPPTIEQKKSIQDMINNENEQKEYYLSLPTTRTVPKTEIIQSITSKSMNSIRSTPTVPKNKHTQKLLISQKKQIVEQYLDFIHDPTHRFHPNNRSKLLREGDLITEQLLSCFINPIQSSIKRL
ncbi:hypothetical protein BC833DRAFT_590131 [Globomyces pollinis-pini]|nr:hypothetical protein BC833DRAFT_590131 [Globomyces pollinis-pini]KAJ2996807.1 hypothetical protein HDV02_006185 [Globomyces sp. JEL0801]